MSLTNEVVVTMKMNGRLPGGVARSFREEDIRWNDHVPEWSNDDSVDFKTVGTFDSSGAFMSKKVRMCLNMWIFLQFVCDIGALLQKKITPVCVESTAHGHRIMCYPH